jgi:hypothetical protein
MDTNQNIEQNTTPISLSSSLTYLDVIQKIIKTFPVYYKIFNSYYNEGKNVSWELNRLYQPIFTGLLEYYSEFMTNGIQEIIEKIESYITENKSSEIKPYAIIDYLEFIFGNVLYETFLHEIKKIPVLTIGYEHLCVFEYIIRVEIIKYNIYLQTVSKIEPNSKILLAMEYRINNCLKKISFCLCYIETNYSSQKNLIELCKDIISESKLESKLDNHILNKITCFMDINKK